MSVKITIVVEGKDDKKFVQDVLSVHYSKELKNKMVDFVFLGSNANELKNQTTLLLARKEAGHEILIILDGDLGSYDETRAIVDEYTQGIDPRVFFISE